MIDFFAAAQRVISILMTGTQLALQVWLVSGGIIYVLRSISFFIDNLLINFIGKIYSYFSLLLQNELFNDQVVDAVLKNIYVFIGVIVFFRLAMVLIKYLINPELVSDDKAGVNSLIKRVVIGLAGILFIPTLFNIATEFQANILEDQVIQQLIIPSDMLEITSATSETAGKKIGVYVFSGFINPSAEASDKIKTEYKRALERTDLSSIDYNSGGFLGIAYPDYDYSYFILLSTFVLGYVLYLMLKYCLDIVVRFFKLFLYQLLAPIAIIEYMINGAGDGVFKSWRQAVLGTYFMLFVRILSIWFVVFVMSLMTGQMPGYTNGSLLANDDYLLRALIIIGLLAFMMDLPKLVGQIFGLDLEQESSATGLLKTIGGGVMKAAGAGLAMGGAALGGAIGAAKGGIGEWNARNAGRANKGKNNEYMKEQALKSGGFKGSMSALGAAKSSMIKSAMGMSQLTGSAYSGFTGVGDAVKSDIKKDAEKQERKEDVDRQKQMLKNQKTISKHQETQHDFDIAKSAVNATGNNKQKAIDIAGSIKFDEKVANMPKIPTANLEAGVKAIQTANDYKAKPEQLAAVFKPISDHFNIPATEVEALVSAKSTPGVKLDVDAVVGGLKNIGKDITTQEMSVKVNQVEGSKINSQADSITQSVQRVVDNTGVTNQKMDTVTQRVERVADNTKATNQKMDTVTQKVERVVDNTKATTRKMDAIKQRVERVVDNTGVANQRLEDMTVYAELNVEATENIANRINKNQTLGNNKSNLDDSKIESLDE